MGGYETVPDAFPDRNEYLSMFCENFHNILQVCSSHVQIQSEQTNKTVQVAISNVILVNIEATGTKFASLYGEFFDSP